MVLLGIGVDHYLKEPSLLESYSWEIVWKYIFNKETEKLAPSTDTMYQPILGKKKWSEILSLSRTHDTALATKPKNYSVLTPQNLFSFTSFWLIPVYHSICIFSVGYSAWVKNQMIGSDQKPDIICLEQITHSWFFCVIWWKNETPTNKNLASGPGALTLIQMAVWLAVLLSGTLSNNPGPCP